MIHRVFLLDNLKFLSGEGHLVLKASRDQPLEGEEDKNLIIHYNDYIILKYDLSLFQIWFLIDGDILPGELALAGDLTGDISLTPLLTIVDYKATLSEYLFKGSFLLSLSNSMGVY